jgi:hypothetical protein
MKQMFELTNIHYEITVAGKRIFKRIFLLGVVSQAELCTNVIACAVYPVLVERITHLYFPNFVEQ